MVTRITHQVRITNPNDKSSYIDVEVLDAFAVLGEDGDEHLYSFQASNPYILDFTGEYGTHGNPLSGRTSHLVRMTNTTDATQFFDVEILDSYSMLGPEGQEWNLALAHDSFGHIVDNTGLNLSVLGGDADLASRIGHIVKIIETTQQHADFDGVNCACTNTDDQRGAPADASGSFTAILKTDAVSTLGSDGDEQMIAFPYYSANKLDATRWAHDDKGAKRPPENPDPNPYVVWPSGAKVTGASGAGWLGATPRNSKTGIVGPINQGPLWWIKRINWSNPSPWYWYLIPQQPMDFSFFGTPPQDAVDAGMDWPWRGFLLSPTWPVIWILWRNFGLEPIPPIGEPSLEASIDLTWSNGSGFWGANWMDYVSNSVPSTDAIEDGLADPAGGSSSWGILPMTAPPIATADIPNHVPNIWQLTGLPQPMDKDGNPKAPTPNEAREAAVTFGNNWNATCGAANALVATISGFVDPGPTWPTYPPAWHWATPYYSNWVPAHRDAFQSGLTVGLFPAAAPLVALQYATSPLIGVGQLDPSVWDTTKFPPQRWANETH